MLHFGLPPRFKPDVKVIQIDISPEEFGNNIKGDRTIALFGDIKSVSIQLLEKSKSMNIKVSQDWISLLAKKVIQNKSASLKLMQDDDLPMTYYRAFAEIKKHLPRNVFLVSEGANTMDIGRTVIDQYLPRSRLDAGTFGTMGVGLGFAIAAQINHPDRMVCCIEGDSAFGFSGMELETACRKKLPILFIVINNNGIYAGMDKKSFESWEGPIPSTILLPDARYDMISIAFGGLGYLCDTPEQVSSRVGEFVESWKQGKAKTTVLNVLISPFGARKAQEFEWLTRTESKL